MQLSVAQKNRLKGLACLAILTALTFSMALYFGFAYGLLIQIGMTVISEAPVLMIQPYLFYIRGIMTIQKKGPEAIQTVEGFDLHEIVEDLAKKLNISPDSIKQIGIIPTNDLQAFTTGSSLLSFLGLGSHGIAISSGLLKSANAYAQNHAASQKPALSSSETKKMARDMVASIIAHELGHITHNDSTSAVITHTIKKYFNVMAAIIIADALAITRIPRYIGIAIGLLSEGLVKTYERTEEIRADETAFNLGHGKSLCFAFDMFIESKKIDIKYANGTSKKHDTAHDYNNILFDFFRLFSSHPKLEDRIAHIQALEEEGKTSKSLPL